MVNGNIKANNKRGLPNKTSCQLCDKNALQKELGKHHRVKPAELTERYSFKSSVQRSWAKGDSESVCSVGFVVIQASRRFEEDAEAEVQRGENVEDTPEFLDL